MKQPCTWEWKLWLPHAKAAFWNSDSTGMALLLTCAVLGMALLLRLVLKLVVCNVTRWHIWFANMGPGSQVCRTYNFGERGTSQGQFYRRYLQPIKLNDVDVAWDREDLRYLEQRRRAGLSPVALSWKHGFYGNAVSPSKGSSRFAPHFAPNVASAGAHVAERQGPLSPAVGVSICLHVSAFDEE